MRCLLTRRDAFLTKVEHSSLLATVPQFAYYRYNRYRVIAKLIAIAAR